MRYVLIFWAAPMGMFWGWYYLSYHDINFGTVYFSRLLHDFAFGFYAQILNQYAGMNIEASAIPAMIARACVIDTLLIMAILAFRRRKRIINWWRQRRNVNQADYRGELLEAGREPLEG